MTIYYIMSVDEGGHSQVVGIYTGRAEFDDALEDAPYNPRIEYETGELVANSPVLT